MNAKFLRAVSLSGLLILSGCATAPEAPRGVEGFNAAKYLGTWYEIARFDFYFERGLDNTTAEYYPGKNTANLGVRNSGTVVATGKRKVAVGKARFRGPESRGELEVSFFGPFWAEYTVLTLDADYRYALIGGKDRQYLWILSRTPSIPEALKREYLDLAESLGFDTAKLIWVEHEPT